MHQVFCPAFRGMIVRGIERRKIFRSDYDPKNFLNRLGELISETQTDCFAWALIPNHAFIIKDRFDPGFRINEPSAHWHDNHRDWKKTKYKSISGQPRTWFRMGRSKT